MTRRNWTIVLAVALTAVIVLGFVFFSDKEETNTEEPVTSAVSYNGGILLLSETGDTTTTTDEDKTLAERNEEDVNDLADRMKEDPVLFTVLAIAAGIGLIAVGVVLAPKLSNKFGR